MVCFLTVKQNLTRDRKRLTHFSVFLKCSTNAFCIFFSKSVMMRRKMEIEHFTKTPNCSSLPSKGKLGIGIFAIISTPEVAPVDFCVTAISTCYTCALCLCRTFFFKAMKCDSSLNSSPIKHILTSQTVKEQ